MASAPPPKTLITPALFSRPLPPPSPGEEGDQPDGTNRVPLSRGAWTGEGPGVRAPGRGRSEAGRTGHVERTTGETHIRLSLDLEGGERQIDVLNGFFGHM